MARKPTLGEIAQADHGILMSKAYTHMLMENPDSVLQQRGRDMRLYDELLRDDQVKPCFQQRRLAVTRSEWDVEPASESSENKAAAEFIKEQLKSRRFDDITNKMLFGIFYGYSVAECLWAYDGNRIVIDDIKVRDRSRFRFGMDGDLRLININHPNGMQLPEKSSGYSAPEPTTATTPMAWGWRIIFTGRPFLSETALRNCPENKWPFHSGPGTAM